MGKYAWWTVLGLLSSSCCALQLLLNAFSFGCAGFNKILGPFRPVSLAVTTLVQASSWYIAVNRPYQWIPTAISTLLVIGLAFLPEFLFWYNRISLSSKIGEKEQQRRRRMETKNTSANTENDEQLLEQRSKTILHYRLDNVGCSACVTTVSNIMKQIDVVEQFDISLDNGGSMSVRVKDNTKEKIIKEKLEEAGFPTQPML